VYNAPAPDSGAEERLRAALDPINRLVALPTQDGATFQATRARILAIIDRFLSGGSVDEEGTRA
jgi:hypothetical protein